MNTRLGSHLARAQFDTRFATSEARNPMLSDIERACLDDVADLYTQIELRYQQAMDEMDDHARGTARVVRTLRVVPIHPNWECV